MFLSRPLNVRCRRPAWAAIACAKNITAEREVESILMSLSETIDVQPFPDAKSEAFPERKSEAFPGGKGHYDC